MVNSTVFGKQIDRGIFEVITWYFPGGNEKKSQKPLSG
jgi:hypothetical protein